MNQSGDPLERLQRLFAQRQCWTIEKLAHRLGYSVISVRRFLKQVGYFSSFTHNNKWYTLSSIPLFDRGGLWFYEDIGFSKHGNLKKTIIAFSAKSAQGLSAKQLAEKLSMPCHAVLHHMHNRGEIDRLDRGNEYVYFAIDEKRKSQQLEHLKLSQYAGGVVDQAEALGAQAAVYVLVEFIKNPQASFEELSKTVAQRQVVATPEAIARFFERHALKKTPP